MGCCTETQKDCKADFAYLIQQIRFLYLNVFQRLSSPCGFSDPTASITSDHGRPEEVLLKAPFVPKASLRSKGQLSIPVSKPMIESMILPDF